MLVNNSLTHSLPFIDVSLACKDGNSKLVEVAFLDLLNIAKGTTDPRVEFISQVAYKS